MRRAPLAGLAAFIMLACLGVGGYAASEPAFTLSADPVEKLLRVQFAAATTPYYVEWTVYGDGRLEKVESYTSDPRRRSQVKLTAEEVQALISRAVDQGLADTSHAALDGKIADGWAQLRPEGQRFTPAIPPPPDDAPTSELEIRLASYRGSKSPHVVLLRRRGVQELACELPMVSELQEWTKLAETLDALVAGEHPK